MEIGEARRLERIAEQLERIADALEKQNVGNQMVMVDGRVFGKLVDDCGKFIPEDSNGPCKPGPSQRCSP